MRGANGLWLTERGPAIHTLTLEELRAFDIGRLYAKSGYAKQFPLQWASDGERFPTLDEFLGLVKPTPVRIDIETKIAPNAADTVDPRMFVRLVVERIRAAGMSARTTLQSFDWRTLVIAKELAPDIESACLTSDETMKG